VLVGLDVADDAGVYRLSDELALVQTVDFFTPIVDDPFAFGAIAAANALSDVYAMGGKALTALNIVCFPSEDLGPDVLRRTIEGGLSKLDEAEVALLGGHTVRDKEFKYGLSVTGTIHPQRIWKKTGGRPGDHLILTKPIGTGVVAQALKKDLASPAQIDAAIATMSTLNRIAASLLDDIDVHASTDITGFGLVGHASQMLASTDVGIVFDTASIPLLDGALEFAGRGVMPGGLKKNRAYYTTWLDVAEGVDDALGNLCNDPQTSGGLLVAVSADEGPGGLEDMHENGIAAVKIGEMVAAHPGRVRLE